MVRSGSGKRKRSQHCSLNLVNRRGTNTSMDFQGWSLVCLADRFYFVCWDGSTLSDGAFVTDLFDDTGDTLQFSSDVLPIDPFERIVSKHQDSMYEKVDIMEQSVVDLNLPFSSPIEMAASNPLQNALSNIMEDEETQDSAKIDDLVIEAMDSISSLSYRESTSLLSPGKEQKRDILSHHERSDRLLQHVESWATLDDTAENKALFEKRGKEIVDTLCRPFQLYLRESSRSPCDTCCVRQQPIFVIASTSLRPEWLGNSFSANFVLAVKQQRLLHSSEYCTRFAA